MGTFVVKGGGVLSGEVEVSGSKNAALPILAATILAENTCELKNIPALRDIQTMYELLACIGCENTEHKNSREFFIEKVKTTTAPTNLVGSMRASFLIMGPLLAKYGTAKIPLPGGCPIGTRPVDLHLKGFMALGAEVEIGHGFVKAKAENGLIGKDIYLDFPSVGATENIMMAATLAKGETVIENAATEPEIVDLAAFLKKMGAKISGAGTDTVKITGVNSLHGARHTIIPDRIEAGTFMTAAAITGGEVNIKNVVPEHVKGISAKLKEMGVDVTENKDSILVAGKKGISPTDIKTMPYPGFPTDMQAQFTSLMSTIKGTSIVTETVFENRFIYTPHLIRMGANIKLDGRTAVVEGGKKLKGASVNATDLRAGAALVLAGLAAQGETEVADIEHIERGYVNFEKKLQKLGANIEKME